MTTQAQPIRSRLDPPPVPRRDFLGLAAMWSALTTLAFGTLGALRLPRAAVVPVPSRKFRVTLPESLPDGEPYIPPGRAVAIVRGQGKVFAISTVCTHLGCIVKKEGNQLACPCHGSAFALDGAVKKGPAPKALPWLAITKLDAGTYLVDEATVVAAGTKVVA